MFIHVSTSSYGRVGPVDRKCVHAPLELIHRISEVSIAEGSKVASLCSAIEVYPNFRFGEGDMASYPPVNLAPWESKLSQLGNGNRLAWLSFMYNSLVHISTRGPRIAERQSLGPRRSFT